MKLLRRIEFYYVFPILIIIGVFFSFKSYINGKGPDDSGARYHANAEIMQSLQVYEVYSKVEKYEMANPGQPYLGTYLIDFRSGNILGKYKCNYEGWWSFSKGEIVETKVEK